MMGEKNGPPFLGGPNSMTLGDWLGGHLSRINNG